MVVAMADLQMWGPCPAFPFFLCHFLLFIDDLLWVLYIPAKHCSGNLVCGKPASADLQ